MEILSFCHWVWAGSIVLQCSFTCFRDLAQTSIVVSKQQITQLVSTQWRLIQQKRADLHWRMGELSDALGWCCHDKLHVKKAVFSQRGLRVCFMCVCALRSYICMLFCVKGRSEADNGDVLWLSSDPDQTSPSTQGQDVLLLLQHGHPPNNGTPYKSFCLVSVCVLF